MNAIILAAISGSSLVNAVVWILIAAVIYFILNWAVEKIGLPEPFHKIVTIIIVIGVALLLINALLTLAGHPLIVW